MLFLASCSPVQATQSLISVGLTVDGAQKSLQLPTGSTVQQALDQAGITLEYLDRVEPPAFTTLADGDTVEVIRVREEFFVEEEVIPFEKQVLQTESLSNQETLLAQSGVNGVREITYRRVFENDIEVSRFPVRLTVVKQAIPEIFMVGIQTPFVPVGIPGRIAYLLAGNAWVMDQNTGNRKAVVVTGDLDGRIFALSNDRSRLLFTRRSAEEDQINTLWVADLSTDPVDLYDLQVSNIIHFADWMPDPKNNQVIFSTVEPRPNAPGWQANNDLNVLSFSSSGWVSKWKIYVDANSGGVYGWWGTEYALEPGGERVAYARPDGVGLVNMDDGSLLPLMDIIPVQTGGDWAWVPGFEWGPDGRTMYIVDHFAPPGSAQPEESPQFDLTALLMDSGDQLRLVPQTGMFAYPANSPGKELDSGEISYQIAYLQSIFPNQSENSRYRLMVMDRDGSNQRELYPPQGEQGLEPQKIV
ncbi:MAG: G5 domain-containing protein, partial [Anaerolineales bacterium]